jgi:dihydropteroate synthase
VSGVKARDAARFSVRPLIPGPEDALRDAVLALGSDSLPELARHGAGEALALQGLAADESRVLERELRKLGGVALLNADADRAVLLGAVAVLGALPQRLEDWGQRTEPLGAAIRAGLSGRGSVPPPVRAGRHVLDVATCTLVMGVINRTPDSFSGDGVSGDADAIALGVTMAQAGAHVIDVGGESTRPNSVVISVDEELARVLPVVRELSARLDIPVSIDTRKAAVAEQALAAGASMVNDIWGLRGDAAMAAVVAGSDAALVAMHNRDAIVEGDVVAEVAAGLRQSLAVAEEAGIPLERVLIDPGLGFAKTPAQNLEILRRLGELRGMGRPIMVGASRKSTIGYLLGGAPPDQRLEGSLALAVLAAARGANVVRVHDVAATVRALQVADAVIHLIPDGIHALPAPGPTG